MFKTIYAIALLGAVNVPFAAQASYSGSSAIQFQGIGCATNTCSGKAIEEVFNIGFGDPADQTLTTLSHVSEYSGIDSQGNYSTMTFSGFGRADFAAGSLKAAINASITNPFYNSQNIPFTES